MSFYISHKHRVCLADCVDLIWSLYSWWEVLGTSSLAILPLGFMWFYFHLWIWVVHWGLLLRLPWRTWVCPSEGQVQRWLQLLGSQGFWQHQVLRGVGGQGSRKYSALEGYGNKYWPIRSSILAWRTSFLDTDAWQATVYKVAKLDTT